MIKDKGALELCLVISLPAFFVSCSDTNDIFRILLKGAANFKLQFVDRYTGCFENGADHVLVVFDVVLYQFEGRFEVIGHGL